MVAKNKILAIYNILRGRPVIYRVNSVRFEAGVNRNAYFLEFSVTNPAGLKVPKLIGGLTPYE